MAEILHLRCRHCGDSVPDNTSPYCPACNLHLMHRAMPFLLGMLLLSPMTPRRAPVTSWYPGNRRRPYPHLKEIMD